MKRKKIVYDDAGVSKVVRGNTTFEGDFVRVRTDDGKEILINKRNVVFIREE